MFYNLTQDRVPCEQTVRNWMTLGKIAYSGDRTYLKHVKKNGRMLTKVEWLKKFIEDLYDETL